MNGRTRAMASAISLLVVAATAAPVLAAAPSNDDIGNAIVIPALPYSDTSDTSEATTGATDPDVCGFGTGATVWYAYTPTDAARLQIDTFGSDYDTTLQVGVSDGQGGLDVIACNDDAAGTVQSRVRIDVEAATTYVIMVGSFASGPGGGLSLQVHLAPLATPLSLALTVDETARFDRSGVATIYGTLVCTGSDQAWLFGSLSQQVGRFRVEGSSDVEVPCDPAGVPWAMPISGHTGSFAGGRATVWIGAEACRDDDCTFDSVERTVRLRR